MFIYLDDDRNYGELLIDELKKPAMQRFRRNYLKMDNEKDEWVILFL